MAWFGRRRRAWQAAISLSEAQATVELRILEWAVLFLKTLRNGEGTWEIEAS